MRSLLALLTFVGLLEASTAAAQDGPVVVELYTSQGCSSCPPADALLGELAKRDDVIALALHVDYWDYIGWKDIFADPSYTARQQAYARAAHATAVYTPQMIVGGAAQVVGSRPMQVMDALQGQRGRDDRIDITLTRRGDMVMVSADAAPLGDYAVQLVRYTPEETVAIRRGELAGKSFRYFNIVTSWNVIARWDGRSALALEADAAGDSPVVVIVQSGTDGPIIGAAQLR